jgi:signal transduction histidine kinase
LYLVIPNRFLYQVLLATGSSIGESFIVIYFLQVSDIPTLFTALFSLGFANLIAVLSSWQFHSYRRTSYQDYVKRQELQAELEKHTEQLETLVAERTEKLKAAERLATIGATAGMVGHDIRNPLTAITGAVYLAKKELTNLPDGETKGKLENSVALIADQTIYVNKIVEDLQDYARPLNPHIEKTRLEKLVKTIFSELRIPKNVQALYVAEKEPELETDSLYLKRILTNLINNGVQAMPEGGKLTVTSTTVNGKVQISVEDTGVGIPEEAETKLFTPLFTTKSKGQGFGLAVVKRLTDALNGTITFESEAGNGTKFILELPQQKAA